jgi:GT2 family glycosyltransferase
MSKLQGRIDRQKADQDHSSGSLSWAVVVATYNRGNVLPECLRLAAEQTSPPSEIVVVDASEDWCETRDLIKKQLQDSCSGIQLYYVQAEEASSATQRNQGTALTNSDLVLFLDDDCLLYPDSMSHVLLVFEHDDSGDVAAVHMTLAPPPRESSFADRTNRDAVLAGKPKPRKGLAEFVRRRLRCNDIFVPYDREWSSPDVPEHLAHLNVQARSALASTALVVRRTLLGLEEFCPLLKAYASGEDTDLTYRLSRHGVLLHCFDAKAHHLTVGGRSRLSRRIVTALGAMNPIAMHVLFSTDPQWSEHQLKRLLRRRLAIELVKDAYYRSWSFPRARGILLARRKLPIIMGMTKDDLSQSYPAMQEELLAQ